MHGCLCVNICKGVKVTGKSESIFFLWSWSYKQLSATQCICWELNLGPSPEQYELLISGPLSSLNL